MVGIWCAVLLIAVGAMGHFFRRRCTVVTERSRGARSLRSAEDVGDDLSKNPPGRTIQIGSLTLPRRVGSGHIAFVGSTGSGKTILQRILMGSVLRTFAPNSGQRALVYDAKQDMSAILAGMKLRVPVHHFNPLDQRSVAWDIAADITSPATALQAASLMIPECGNDANPFFRQAARQLLCGAIISLVIQKPGRWSLKDLLLTTRNGGRLTSMLAESAETEHMTQFFEHPATSLNIMSTLMTHLAQFEIIAAAWEHCRQKMSLDQWVKGSSVLVLGNDERHRSAIDVVNRLIFQRISEIVLGGAECAAPSTWLFLDEVREAGRLPGLSSLLTKGRSKGAAVILGFQDICGLRDAYGTDVANEIVGQCNTKVILRLNSPETAEWGSRLFGSEELVETRFGDSRATGSVMADSQSRSHGVVIRPLVLDGDLLSMPETSPQTGLTAYVTCPLTGPLKMRMKWREIESRLSPPDGSVPGIVVRPARDQYLTTTCEETSVLERREKPFEFEWRARTTSESATTVLH